MRGSFFRALAFSFLFFVSLRAHLRAHVEHAVLRYPGPAAHGFQKRKCYFTNHNVGTHLQVVENLERAVYVAVVAASFNQG